MAGVLSSTLTDEANRVKRSIVLCEALEYIEIPAIRDAWHFCIPRSREIVLCTRDKAVLLNEGILVLSTAFGSRILLCKMPYGEQADIA